MAGYGPSGFAPNQVTANYLSGRQAADQERSSNQVARARDQAYEQNFLSQQREQQGLSDEQQKAFATKMVQAAQYGIQSSNPKAFIEQNFPQLAQLAGDKWATATDEDVKASLQDAIGKFGPVAGIGPAAPAAKWTSTTGPRGSVIQENSATGERKQVVGPDNTQVAPGGSTQRVPSGYRYAADGALEPIPGGPADLNARPKNLRAVPPAVAQGVISNRQELAKIDRALAALEANPDAFGMQNYLPDALTQRVGGKSMAGGVDPRAKVADISSMVVHDRSGAAVSASEFPRLAPFIPQKTDDPKTVKTKLENMRVTLQAMNEEVEGSYTEDSGYRPIGGQTAPDAPQAGQPMRVRSIQEAMKLPSGTVFLTPDGRRKVRP